jgi:hypothetical protein
MLYAPSGSNRNKNRRICYMNLKGGIKQHATLKGVIRGGGNIYF